MWWDTEFNLVEHGDRYERLWWPLLRNDFPEWEIFWIHHVVPLTCRIDDKIANSDPRKLFLRDDAKNDENVESMIMSNYSVFYYMARGDCNIISRNTSIP
jgi:hypothetical protein